MKEKLSVLMDGELSEAESQELLSQLKTDSDLRATWYRYHLVASALRDETMPINSMELADRISKKIENEPTIVSPANWWRQSNKKVAKMAGSFAIAASVAAIAIISLQVETTEQASPQNIAKLEPVALSDFIRTSGTHWSKGTSRTEKTLNLYLVEHSEFNPASNFKGMMGYGRIVSYDMIE